jgi:hypothetical protein
LKQLCSRASVWEPPMAMRLSRNMVASLIGELPAWPLPANCSKPASFTREGGASRPLSPLVYLPGGCGAGPWWRPTKNIEVAGPPPGIPRHRRGTNRLLPAKLWLNTCKTNCQKGAILTLLCSAGCDIKVGYTSDIPTAQGESI